MIIGKLANKLASFTELESPLPSSQDDGTGPAMSLLKLVYNLILYFFRISSHLSLGHPCDHVFRLNISHEFLISYMRATSLAHLIRLDLITLIIFCEEHKF